eukprot:6537890-Ditylum_brightwellii.AAC.1
MASVPGCFRLANFPEKGSICGPIYSNRRRAPTVLALECRTHLLPRQLGFWMSSTLGRTHKATSRKET